MLKLVSADVIALVPLLFLASVPLGAMPLMSAASSVLRPRLKFAASET